MQVENLYDQSMVNERKRSIQRKISANTYSGSIASQNTMVTSSGDTNAALERTISYRDLELDGVVEDKADDSPQVEMTTYEQNENEHEHENTNQEGDEQLERF